MEASRERKMRAEAAASRGGSGGFGGVSGCRERGTVERCGEAMGKDRRGIGRDASAGKGEGLMKVGTVLLARSSSEGPGAWGAFRHWADPGLALPCIARVDGKEVAARLRVLICTTILPGLTDILRLVDRIVFARQVRSHA
jgi:hypothetical protein